MLSGASACAQLCSPPCAPATPLPLPAHAHLQVQGEVITALVFPGQGAAGQIAHSTLQQGLHTHCLAHLAPYQAPRRFVILDAPLPRNAMGKVNKKELLRLFFSHELQQAEALG